MPIVVQCPNPACGVSSSVGEAVSGRNVKCKKCGTPFIAKPTFDGEMTDTKKSHPASTGKLFSALPANFGRYRVLKLLGQGGMGAVYLAEDSQLGRQVALKMPFFDAAESPQRVERFVREARSAAVLHHPNICTVFDAGQIEGRPFITMAFIAGRTLEAILDSDDLMPQHQAAEIVRKVALGLAHAHGKGTVHRDLKPANVMIADDGEPVVTDFGLAKRVADVDPSEVKLTRLGGIVGTPSYMSPEQVRGEGIGSATDIYSLGVMLFEMLTGKTPYNGSMGVVMGQILSAPVPPVREFRPDVDSRLDALCRKAMAKDPTERFASMTEFANALGRYQEAPTASPPPLPLTVTVEVERVPSPMVDRSPFGDLEDLSTPGPVTKRVKKGRGKLVVLALALLVPLAIGFAAVLIRFETANGTILVEMNDDEVETRFKGGMLILSGADGKVRYTLTAKDRSKKLKAGAYTIHVEGADGLALDTPEFTLRKGSVVTVRVTMMRPKEVEKTDQSGTLDMPKKGDAITNSIGMKLVYILPGKFSMGSPKEEVGRNNDEGPEHEVEITKGFYMGVYEVTQGEYLKMMGNNPSRYTAMATPRFPVEWVSHDEAVKFCEKLSASEKDTTPKRLYRLPTEAEWEYACRGGASSKTPYWYGKTLSTDQANFKDSKLERPREVGSYKPNGFGLFDMHGNVGEWVADWYSPDYYLRSPGKDPAGPTEGQKRMIRGGAWSHLVGVARSAHRQDTQPPTSRVENLGFRVVMVLAGKVSEKPADPLPIGSKWTGKRTYSKTYYNGTSVTYDLHVLQREMAHFKGVKFDNGPNRNRAEVEGEIMNGTITWKEPAGKATLWVTGELNGDTIKFKIDIHWPDGAVFLFATGELCWK